MDVRYVTQPSDHLDLICKRHYGFSAGTVEAVLAVNHDIAHLAHRLPAGTTVVLPDLGEVRTATVRPKLWG